MAALICYFKRIRRISGGLLLGLNRLCVWLLERDQMFHAFYPVVKAMWKGMKGFCVTTVWDVSRRNVACYRTLLEAQWLRKRHITFHPMNWGLTKFQNDYILAGETFTPKPNAPLVLHETNLVMQLLGDLSFRAYLELKLIWQLTSILYRHLHAWIKFILCMILVLHHVFISAQLRALFLQSFYTFYNIYTENWRLKLS